MRLQSSHPHANRGLDPYMSPPEAIAALLSIERVPTVLWEPAAGDGTGMVLPLRATGRAVYASDVADYGCPAATVADYLTASVPAGVKGVVTNPPYRRALEFIRKALSEVDWCAFLLRTNFLESTGRLPFFRSCPPARVWISSRRLPMMHRQGWTGPKASSNTAHAWFVWDAQADVRRTIGWFDYAEGGPLLDIRGKEECAA